MDGGFPDGLLPGVTPAGVEEGGPAGVVGLWVFGLSDPFDPLALSEPSEPFDGGTTLAQNWVTVCFVAVAAATRLRKATLWF